MTLGVKLLISVLGLVTAIVTLMATVVDNSPDPPSPPWPVPGPPVPGPGVDRNGFACGNYSADPNCWVPGRQ